MLEGAMGGGGTRWIGCRHAGGPDAGFSRRHHRGILDPEFRPQWHRDRTRWQPLDYGRRSELNRSLHAIGGRDRLSSADGERHTERDHSRARWKVVVPRIQRRPDSQDREDYDWWNRHRVPDKL